MVLVEGVSDQRAVEALAARGGRSLLDEGVAVLSIGGATSIRTYLDRFDGCLSTSARDDHAQR